MKRNRILALLLAGCMVLGNSNVLLYAEEADEQLFTIEEDNESEIQEDDMEDQVDEEDDLYACDLIEDEEEELYAAETADTMPPEIDIESLTVTYPEGKNTATVGDEVRISVKAVDEESGVKSVQISYRFPLTGRDRTYGMTETGTAGVYEVVIPISEDSPSGEYQITNIIARDKKDNSVYFYNENLYPIVPYADLSAGNFIVTEMFSITFNTNGGSEIATQYVVAGGRTTRPDLQPTKEGYVFGGWYADEGLTQSFYFSDPVNENITLYAKWNAVLGINSYDVTSEKESAGGKFMTQEGALGYGWMIKTMEPDTDYILKAFPDNGYKFKGWYEGRVEDIYVDGRLYSQTILPKDLDDHSTLLSTDMEYSFMFEQNLCICAVFEVCTDHDFGPEQIKEATLTEEGCIYHVCQKCGTEEIVKVLPKISPIITTPTIVPQEVTEQITIPKKPTNKKPSVSKNKITINWKHFKQNKKTKPIWKKIKKVQIQCATDSAFTNIVKNTMVGKKKTKATIKGLAKKTTYYVRVRYYDGTGYSAWSGVKKVKTK